MLGAKDRRVPPPDGLQYYAALRSVSAASAAAGGARLALRLMVFPGRLGGGWPSLAPHGVPR